MVLCHHHDVDWGSKTLISDMGLDNSLGHAGKVVTEQYSEVILDNEMKEASLQNILCFVLPSFVTSPNLTRILYRIKWLYITVTYRSF